MTFVRSANSAPYRSMSLAVDRGRREEEPRPPAHTALSSIFTGGHGTPPMHLAFDICQGIGIACAVGIRPFLPALVAGGLAAGNVEIHFDGTDYSFLQSAPFLLGMAVGAIALAVIERRQIDSEPLSITLGAIGAALGALFFAGALAHGHYTSWPGLIGGVICAVVATLATRPLLVRVRTRLDRGGRGGGSAVRRGYGRTRLRAVDRRAADRPDRVDRAAVAADRRPPAVGPEVRRAADPALIRPIRGTILS